PALVDQGRHLLLWIQLDVVGAELLALAQVDEFGLVREALEIERDARAIGRGRAVIGVEDSLGHARFLGLEIGLRSPIAAACGRAKGMAQPLNSRLGTKRPASIKACSAGVDTRPSRALRCGWRPKRATTSRCPRACSALNS